MPPPLQLLRVFAGSAFAIAIAGAVAWSTGQPWLFPSLGPTVMLHIEKPEAPESAPRNTLIGHAVALAAGWLMLVAFRLTGTESILVEGVTVPRIAAAAGSLAITAAVLLLLRTPHPPAGATTLLVSLGLLHTGTQLLVAMFAVVLVTYVDWLFDRAFGQPLPFWAHSQEASHE